MEISHVMGFVLGQRPEIFFETTSIIFALIDFHHRRSQAASGNRL